MEIDQHKSMKMTPQRIAIMKYLDGNVTHPSAADIYGSLRGEFPTMSLATVYNTLNQFTEAGLLREVAIEGDRSYFDTNTSNHFHYYLENEGRLLDIEGDDIKVIGLPDVPAGTEIDRIDVIVRLRGGNTGKLPEIS